MVDDDTTLHNRVADVNSGTPRAVELGSFRVTALYDGHFDFPLAYLEGSDHHAQPEGMFRADVNAFLIQSATRNYLVDTGAGGKLGPDFNRLPLNLRAAGLAPADIDAVLLTHIHPDHTNGLVDADNTPLFEKAEILVHQKEVDFWLSEAGGAAGAPELRQFVDWAQEAFAPYAGRIAPFTDGEIVSGIEAIPLFGHTPGHSGFQIDGGGGHQLLIWGDAVHEIQRQSRDPDISVRLDMDQAAARATRWSLFDRVAADDLLVTGMHVTYPGFGRLRRNGTGFDYAAEG